MKKATPKYEPLDQYDYGDTEVMEMREKSYAPAIGLLLIRFSEVEHELNIAIAEELHSGTHEVGYAVIETLFMKQKINLFYKLYLRRVNLVSPKRKSSFGSLVKRLQEATTFRNEIAHANWIFLTKDGYVRTKIQVDNTEGYVEFKAINITPPIIHAQVRELNALIKELPDFVEAITTD